MKKYDVVIPLGEFCLSAIGLRDSGIRKNSYPFDWSGAKDFEKCGNCGLPGKIKMICEDFVNAFNLEDLKEFWSSNKEHRGVFNTRTGLLYMHDFEWEQSVEEQYPVYLEKYERRIRRFYDDILGSEKVLFVFSTRGGHQIYLDEIREGLRLLNDKFPNKDIDFLFVRDSEDISLFETKYFKVDDHIHIFLYKDIPANGDSNQDVIKKIFSQFIKGEVEYNFSTDNIKNYGLSVKENWGRWTDGHDAYIDIPVFTDSGVEITFAVYPYVVEQHKVQDIDVFLGDEKIANWYYEFGKGAPSKTVKIPSDKIRGDSLTLHFYIKNPVSPRELGREQDGRKLGLRFVSMKITAVNS